MSYLRRIKRKAQFHVAEVVPSSVSEVYDYTTSNRRVRRRRNPETIIVTEPTQPTVLPTASPLPEQPDWEDDHQPEELEDEVSGIKIRAKQKTKRYESTVRARRTCKAPRMTTLSHQASPLSVWLPHRTEYLLEYCRHDGPRGVGRACDACEKEPSVARCEDCFVDEVLCAPCVLSCHARNPLHFIKVCWLLPHMLQARTESLPRFGRTTIGSESLYSTSN